MHNAHKKASQFIFRHKLWSSIIALIIVVVLYKVITSLLTPASQTVYTIGTASTGTITSSVTGTGQVDISTDVDVPSQTSGAITKVYVSEGQSVKAGDLLATIDPTQNEKAVRDAQANLDSANLSLAKLEEPPTALALSQSQDAITKAQADLATAQQNLKKDYDSGFNSVSNAFLDLPNVMNGLQSMFFDDTISQSKSNIDYFSNASAVYDTTANLYEQDTYTKYQTALAAYNANYNDYKATNAFSSASTTVSLLNETYTTTKDVSAYIASATNLIQFYETTLKNRDLKPIPAADNDLTSLSSYTGTINNDLTTLLNAQNSIVNDQSSIVSAQNTINESSLSLQELQAGANAIDLQSAQLAVEQKQNALADAQANLSYNYVRAPFNGTVSKLDVQQSQLVGSGTTIATIVASDQYADIALNEVDAAKVKTGDKAVMTFDAISDLSLTGKVQSIDTVGTVSQGVVTYNVKISFDVPDSRIRAGMTVSASIITQVEQNVVIVPSTAVKTSGNISYVQTFAATIPSASMSAYTTSSVPTNVPVNVGISDGTYTEITRGLKDGQQIITKTTVTSGSSSTVTKTTTITSSSATRSILSGGLGGLGGGRPPGQ
jgi:HlyD family secretion protein